jgi:hypothetical protein
MNVNERSYLVDYRASVLSLPGQNEPAEKTSFCTVIWKRFLALIYADRITREVIFKKLSDTERRSI